MSTKTLRKRSALVAVSAMGFGLLTSVAANAATSVDAITGTYCAWYDTNGDITATDANVTSMVVPVGGSFTVSLDDTAANRVTVAAPGLITAVTASDDSDPTANSVDADGLGATLGDTDTDTVTIKGNAVGSFKIKTATVAAPGTIVDEISVTVVASCDSTTWSATKSGWAFNTAAKTVLADLQGEVDSVYTYVDGDTLYLSVRGMNSYNAALPTGTWIVSATGGAVVGISATSSPAVGVTSVASLNTDGTNADGGDAGADTDPGVYIAVEQATSGTALNTTVSLSYNGVTVLSKPILFTGDIAKITVSGVDVENLTGSLTGVYDATAQDAAGNYIAWALTGDSSKYDSIVTSVTGGTTLADSSGTLAASAWTCNSKSGKTTVRLQATTNAGTTIYSNEFVAACGGAAYTYAASLDKASYVPGDIATLTITAKDASGFAPFKGETVDAAGTAATNANILGSQMTPTAQPLMADTFDANGVKKYTFSVGSTEGSYNMAVNLGYTGNDAISVPYTIKASSSTVTNAEVLAAIVKLIASINKQIAALQKALKK